MNYPFRRLMVVSFICLISANALIGRTSTAIEKWKWKLHDPAMDSGCAVVLAPLVPLEPVCFNGAALKLEAYWEYESELPDSFSVLYLLVDSLSSQIEAIGREPVFYVQDTGYFQIFPIAFDTELPLFSFVEAGESSLSQLEAWITTENTCSSVGTKPANFGVKACSKPCNAFPGILRVVPKDACWEEKKRVALEAIHSKQPHVPDGFSLRYVLTQGETRIVRMMEKKPSFWVSQPGQYQIHTLIGEPEVFENEPWRWKRDSLSTLIERVQVEGRCFAWDSLGASFSLNPCDFPCLSEAGSLTELDQVCWEGRRVKLHAQTDEPPKIPIGHRLRYVLSKGSSMEIQAFGKEPKFTVGSLGEYRIHPMVFPTHTSLSREQVLAHASITELMVSIEEQSICADLDPDGAYFDLGPCHEKCEINVDALVPEPTNCWQRDQYVQLSAKQAYGSPIPFGHEKAYLLTKGEEHELIDVGQSPIFSVGSPGPYVIYPMVYDPQQFEPNKIMEQGLSLKDLRSRTKKQGLCLSIGSEGAKFFVEACFAQFQVCHISAAELVASPSPTCLIAGSSISLAAIERRAPEMPDGFSSSFVWVEEDSGKIVEVASQPEFTTTKPGTYTLYNVVYQASQVHWDITDFGSWIDKLLLFQEDSVCAVTNKVGVSFRVWLCEDEADCQPSAGTLKAGNYPTCIPPGEMIRLEAGKEREGHIPPGCSGTYVLIEHTRQKLIATDLNPMFMVDLPGRYGIHEVVFETVKEEGVFNLLKSLPFELWDSALSVRNICFGLDPFGARFTIEPCKGVECSLEAPGFESPEWASIPDTLCLEYGGGRRIMAAVDTLHLPEGFANLFVRTDLENGIILEVSHFPEWQFTQSGTFGLNSVVVDSRANTWGLMPPLGLKLTEWLGLLEDMALCFSLEEKEVHILAAECGCLVDPGMLIAETKGCLTGQNEVPIELGIGEAPVVPEGFQLAYLLSKGPEKRIQGLFKLPFISIGDTGQYAVHGWVYPGRSINWQELEGSIKASHNPILPANKLDGMTLKEFDQYLGTLEICYKLDLQGANFKLAQCQPEELLSGHKFKLGQEPIDESQERSRPFFDISPNPAYGTVFVKGENTQGGPYQVSLWNMQGKHLKTLMVNTFNQPHMIDLAGFSVGFYALKIETPDGEIFTYNLALQR